MRSNNRRNSFRLLWTAIKSSRQSMWISLQVLIVLTIVLATIFFMAEYREHGPEYNYFDSLIWAFTRYIEDPGEFATVVPSTFVGRWVATLIGIVGIMIFAVPAGLIGAAFTSAIEDEQHKRHLVLVGERLEKAFRRKQEPLTMFKCVPRYISLGTLQALKNMTQNDIVDAVEYNRNFRLRNLANAELRGTHALDQLVVEMFPLNTEYGCCINRGSDITVACPTAVSEAAIGNFAYYLALIGGFNYISKEIETDVDDPTSYYIISDQQKNQPLIQFITDLKNLSTGRKHWTIFIISSESKKDTELHFIEKANSKAGVESTVMDSDDFNNFYHMAEREIDEGLNIKSDLNQLRPVGPKNIAVVIGGGSTTNALTIRISSELVVWDSRYLVVAKELASAMALTLGESYGEKMTPKDILKQSGYGY